MKKIDNIEQIIKTNNMNIRIYSDLERSNQIGEEKALYIEIYTNFGDMFVEEHLNALAQFVCDYLEDEESWYFAKTFYNERLARFYIQIYERLKENGKKTDKIPILF